MHLTRLVYASEFAKEKFPLSELAKIHKISKANNGKIDISGILAYGTTIFFSASKDDALPSMSSIIKFFSIHDTKKSCF